MDERLKALREGMKYGLWLYSHCKNGTVCVGTMGKTLKNAIDEVNRGDYDIALRRRRSDEARRNSKKNE
jgi:hypothetical protein